MDFNLCVIALHFVGAKKAKKGAQIERLQ